MDIPARKRNALHVAAGFPPCYPELGLASEAVAPYRFAVERLLQVHEPCPAFAIDRWWNVVTANEGAVRFTALFGPPPADLLTGMLAPGPIREALENYAEVAATIMRRLRREVADAAPDGKLQQMLDRVQRLVGPLPATTGETGDLLVCPRFRVHGQTIATVSMIARFGQARETAGPKPPPSPKRQVSMIARFGQAREVSLDELRIELLYPADAVGEAFFRNLADAAVPRAALPGIT